MGVIELESSHRKVVEDSKKRKQDCEDSHDKKKILKSEADETKPSDDQLKNVKGKNPKNKKEKAKKKNDDCSAVVVNAENSKNETLMKNASLGYLEQWKTDKNNWSFKKKKQIWLVKNMYNPDTINDNSFSNLLEYLKGCKGLIRQRIIKAAQQFSDDNEIPKVHQERAHQVLQVLSES